MPDLKKQKLSDYTDYVQEKILVKKLDNNTYISTENMLPDRGGITKSSGLPNTNYTQCFSEGDILLSNIRPYFKKIWYATFNGGCSNDVLVLRAKSNVCSKFLYYVLSDDKFFEYDTATSKGTKMPRGDKVAIMKYGVPQYDLPIQEKIARVLSSLDDKIELNNKINQNLEQQAQAIFKSWFVDFEPFGGKIPEDWEIGTISELGTVVGGSTPSKKNPEYYTNNGIAWITPKDLSRKNLKFISKGEIDITDKGFKNSSVTLMPKGTVLFSSRAPIGYISIAQNDITTNQGFKSVIPFQTVGTPYVYLYLKNNITLIENMAAGSTFKEVSGSIMQNIPALIPSKETLKRFNLLCDTIFRKQEYLEIENEKLTQLRDTLLPKLMSGEIDVDKI